MPRAKMMDMGSPPTPAVAAVWTREDAVPLWLTLDATYGTEPQIVHGEEGQS
jgi:hypothetical protein